MADLAGLPGAALVTAGLADLAAGRDTVPALAVAMAARRLQRLGLPVARTIPDAELRLYRALARQQAEGAYGRYNAVVREIVSFARALEREHGKKLRQSTG